MEDRVAIVSGAGKGLGRAYALALARQGICVVVNNRVREGRDNSADQVVEEIRATGGEAVANYEHAEALESGECLVEEALGHYGRLDIVIANAGVDEPVSFHKQSLAEFERIFAINFMGTARLLHAAWPVLREAGYGRVLVSTSSAGLYGNHGQSAYSASKAALIGLMRALHIEKGSRDLCINALAPYAVTPLTRPWFPEALVDKFSAEAVAKVAAWLVSEQSRVSGQTLIAGAGYLRRARVLESDSYPVQDDPGTAIELLNQMPALCEPESANAEFEAFTSAIP